MTPNALIPPAELIVANGIGTTGKADVQAEFADLGARMAKGLIFQGRLTPASRVLDIGCGLGRVARGFTDYLTTGEYVGVDIVNSSVAWCDNAYSHLPDFNFIHADLFSKHYNPQSTTSAAEYKFPFEDKRFDFVFSMSLFTHLMWDAASNYLREIARLLKPGCRTFNTFFLLDEVSDPLAIKTIPHPVTGGRVQSLDAPEAVVAFYVDQIRAEHERCGLEVVYTGMGHWSGRKDTAAGYQDAIVAVRS
jgi:SAM-dependent methyltransferase